MKYFPDREFNFVSRQLGTRRKAWLEEEAVVWLNEVGNEKFGTLFLLLLLHEIHTYLFSIMQTVKIWWPVTSVIFMRAMESTRAAFGTLDTRSIQCVVVSTKRQFALGRRRTRLIFMPFIAEMDKAERGGERSIYYSSMSTALAVTEGICIPMTINDSEKPFSQWNRRWIKSFLSLSFYLLITTSIRQCYSIK